MAVTNDIAFGDFNGDGFLDIVRATRSSGRVELNNGNATFEESTRQTGIRPTSVVVADFNNDGSLDLVFGSTDSVTTWLNHGNGAFENTSSLGNFFSPVEEMVAGDFNGDGLIDVMFGAPTSSLRELRNVGSGQFEFGRFAGFDTARIQAADFDGDGDLDLIGSGNDDVILFNESQFFRQTLFARPRQLGRTLNCR